MEFLQGGDLMTLLMKKDILTEEEAKFYIAECILAVESVHKINYLHRDLKPDNILIGSDGHSIFQFKIAKIFQVKLSDFGLCKFADIKPQIHFGQKIVEKIVKLGPKREGYRRNRKLAFSTVGTPDYIAPEVFCQKGYTETVDWWSLGVILFEMLVGYPPFFSDDPTQTCQKIINWQKNFRFPKEAQLSNEAIDIISKLIAQQSERLGINGVEEIKLHPFFYGIDWKNLRNSKPPNVHQVIFIIIKNNTLVKFSGELDLKEFEEFQEDKEKPWFLNNSNIQQENQKNWAVSQNYLKNYNKQYQNENAWKGYTYKRNQEQERSALINALLNMDQIINTTKQVNNYNLFVMIIWQRKKNQKQDYNKSSNETERKTIQFSNNTENKSKEINNNKINKNQILEASQKVIQFDRKQNTSNLRYIEIQSKAMELKQKFQQLKDDQKKFENHSSNIPQMKVLKKNDFLQANQIKQFIPTLNNLEYQEKTKITQHLQNQQNKFNINSNFNKNKENIKQDNINSKGKSPHLKSKAQNLQIHAEIQKKQHQFANKFEISQTPKALALNQIQINNLFSVKNNNIKPQTAYQQVINGKINVAQAKEKIEKQTQVRDKPSQIKQQMLNYLQSQNPNQKMGAQNNQQLNLRNFRENSKLQLFKFP